MKSAVVGAWVLPETIGSPAAVEVSYGHSVRQLKKMMVCVDAASAAKGIKVSALCASKRRKMKESGGGGEGLPAGSLWLRRRL